MTTGGRFEVAPHSCFACGELNAVGLRLVLHVAGDTCWTETTLAPTFQGWEDVTHGGIVATILDEVMGWALIERDMWGVTARLNVEFKKPVPIGAPIRCEGHVVSVRRRVVEVEGTLTGADGTVLATATATYVAAPEARPRTGRQPSPAPRPSPRRSAGPAS